MFTIVYGLILTDLFASFHKLLRARKKVTWHWLPLLTAWYIFLLILKNWWDLAFLEDTSSLNNIIFLIAYGHLLLLLFLLASSALPDKIQKNGINLKDYYFQNHRYFWGIMSAVGLLSLLIAIVKKLTQEIPLNPYNIGANIIFLTLTILMATNKKYWFHAVILILFVVLTLLEIVEKV